MAARVTKQFLQHVLQHDAKQKSAGKGALLGKNQSLKKQQHQASTKKVSAGKATTTKSNNKKVKGSAATAKKKATERFLDAAKKEQAQADRTRENVQKLQVRPTDKSQRLMAKVLALRRKALH